MTTDPEFDAALTRMIEAVRDMGWDLLMPSSGDEEADVPYLIVAHPDYEELIQERMGGLELHEIGRRGPGR